MRDERDIALKLMEGLSCPRSLTVAILLRHGEWDQLTSLKVDPLHYCSPDSYRRAAGATEFLRKFDSFPLDLDLEATTLEKWWSSEHACFRANRRINSWLDFGIPPEPWDADVFNRFIKTVRQQVSSVLGSRPPDDLDGRFGPGATMSDTSRYSTVPDKMSSVPTLTPNSWPFVVPFAGTMWGRACAQLGRSPRFIRGNRYFTVPKSSRARRPCAKEPSINGFYQLGVGSVMKRLLRSRAGIDLVHGQEEHKRVACASSYDEAYATIDLSSASDTVATSLVKLLLPPRWYELLDALRSPFTQVNGKWVRLEKFSSMGNGFTFELETLIFWAISTAMCDPSERYEVRVYGDDIIVPTHRAQGVLSALTWFGFTPNLDKTFVKGSFRESCGGDFFNGEPVRAHYLEESLDEPSRFISLANGVRRFASQGGPRLQSDLLSTWFKILGCIPSQIRCLRGPEALGDIVVHDREERWTTRWRDSIRFVKCYLPLPVRKVRWGGFAYDVQLAAAVYGSLFVGVQDGRVSDDTLISSRLDAVGYRIGWTEFS